jgi:hypothetical protein
MKADEKWTAVCVVRVVMIAVSTTDDRRKPASEIFDDEWQIFGIVKPDRQK